MPPKPPNPIDVHVGKRIQMRRVEQKMSRATLGEFIGLTHQQIEKYERGVNRIGASRIQQICTALKIPVSFVFEGAPGSSPSVNGVCMIASHVRWTCMREKPEYIASKLADIITLDATVPAARNAMYDTPST